MIADASQPRRWRHERQATHRRRRRNRGAGRGGRAPDVRSGPCRSRSGRPSRRSGDGRDHRRLPADAGAGIFPGSRATPRQVAREPGVPWQRTPVQVRGGRRRNGRFSGINGGDRPAPRPKAAPAFLPFRPQLSRGTAPAAGFRQPPKTRAGDPNVGDDSGLLDPDAGERAAERFESGSGAEVPDRFVQPLRSSYIFGCRKLPVRTMTAARPFGRHGVAWPGIPETGLGEFMDAVAGSRTAPLRLPASVRRTVRKDGAVRGVGAEAGLIDAAAGGATATVAPGRAPEVPPGLRNAPTRGTHPRCCRAAFGAAAPFGRMSGTAAPLPPGR